MDSGLGLIMNVGIWMDACCHLDGCRSGFCLCVRKEMDSGSGMGLNVGTEMITGMGSGLNVHVETDTVLGIGPDVGILVKCRSAYRL